MATLKLSRVPEEVLRAHVVVDSVIPSLHGSPEGFHSVRMRLAVHILRDAVLDGMMVVGQPHVGPVLIGVDGRIVGYPLSNELSRPLGSPDSWSGPSRLQPQPCPPIWASTESAPSDAARAALW